VIKLRSNLHAQRLEQFKIAPFKSEQRSPFYFRLFPQICARMT
jgi:hypothetical protein